MKEEHCDRTSGVLEVRGAAKMRTLVMAAVWRCAGRRIAGKTFHGSSSVAVILCDGVEAGGSSMRMEAQEVLERC